METIVFGVVESDEELDGAMSVRVAFEADWKRDHVLLDCMDEDVDEVAVSVGLAEEMEGFYSFEAEDHGHTRADVISLLQAQGWVHQPELETDEVLS